MTMTYLRGLTAVASVFGIDIQPLTAEWATIYSLRAKAHGKEYAIKFMKNLLTCSERYALRQTIDPIPWTKSNKDGFPIILNKFKTYLRSKDPKVVIMALSVMRAIEEERLPISKDISTVTSKYSGDSEIIQSICEFIPVWVKGITPLTLPEMNYHPTVKNGPNGHALWASDKDIRSVMATPELYGAIRTVEGKLNDKHPMEEIDDQFTNLIHSRLTQFPEKAGKTRTIAVIDYYSQRCLRPLHKGLMNILNTLVSDGTNSHMNVGKYAQNKTKEKSFIYCADLTAATDRFPKEIQRVLLFELIKDNDLAAALWTLLAERTFTVAWSGEKVTYECGQPMGAYASWPLFALAHHLVVEYSAVKAGLPITKAKNLYRVIGDDVIITHEATAMYYERVIQLLGVELNFGKTVKSLPSQSYSCAEVAKQLYLNGTCLTPLTPGIVRDLRKVHMFNACVRVLNDRYDFSVTDQVPMLISKLYPKIKLQKQVWVLCSNPVDGIIKPGNPGYDELCPWTLLDHQLCHDLYRDMRVEQVMNAAISYTGDIGRQYAKSGDPWVDHPGRPPIAVNYVVNDMKKQLDQSVQKFEFSFGPETDKILEEIAYIPDPVQPYRSRRELKLQRQSRLIMDIHKQMMEWL